MAFAYVFEFFHESVSDGHSGEPFFPPVSPGLGVSAQSGDQTEVQAETVDEPLHSRGAFLGQNPIMRSMYLPRG